MEDKLKDLNDTALFKKKKILEYFLRCRDWFCLWGA